MGIQDRDWYKDELRKRAGMKPKWDNWRNRSSPVDRLRNPNLPKPSRPWHPVLMVMVWVVIFLLIFIVSKKIVS